MRGVVGKYLVCAIAVLGLLGLGHNAMATAGIVGDCSDCHTMHNSIQGKKVAKTGLTGTLATTGIQDLLKFDCIACHANPNATSALYTLPGGSVVPQVYWNNDGSGQDLAGGNFADISKYGNHKGHNVVDVVSAETDVTTPPGFRHADGAIMSFDVTKFTCAGSMGCHGFRGQALSSQTLTCNLVQGGEKYINGVDTGQLCTADELNNQGTTTIYRNGLDALSGYDGPAAGSEVLIKGAHHSSFDGLKNDGFDPSFYDNPLARSYRFLYGMRGYGNEVDRWQNVDSKSHNEYAGGYANSPLGDLLKSTDFGTTGTCALCHRNGQNGTNSEVYTSGGTMTGFCVTCHGTFHSSGGNDNGTAGAFLRHPSDFALPTDGEYTNYTTYDVSAPVARPASFFTAGMKASDKVNPGQDLVMCLSCHKAHATPNDFMLRFNYGHIDASGNYDSTGVMTAGQYPSISTAQAAGGCLACHTEKGVLPQSR